MPENDTELISLHRTVCDQGKHAYLPTSGMSCICFMGGFVCHPKVRFRDRKIDYHTGMGETIK